MTWRYFAEPGPIAKSTIVLDVKPWDDETDLKEMERLIRQIQTDGLVWGACKTPLPFPFQQTVYNSWQASLFVLAKFLPVAYGIQKLQIGCVVEDDKVIIDYRL